MQNQTPNIITLDPNNMREAVTACAALLAAGGLALIPTDTVYGLAADPRVAGAHARLHAAKQRDADQPIAYLAPSTESVVSFGARLNAQEQRLAKAFWPGPLTLILQMATAPAEPDMDVVEEGFRVPDDPFVRELLLSMKTPLLVSSANISGAAPALNAEAARQQLGAQVDLCIDAGPVPGGAASSVVRASGATLEILREEALSAAQLRKVVQA